MRSAILLTMLAGALVLPGCARLNPFAGNAGDMPYDARLSTDRAGGLTVQVAAGGAGIDAVRESARLAVTTHCLKQSGSSDANWVMDPSGQDWAATRDERGDLTFRARCRA